MVEYLGLRGVPIGRDISPGYTSATSRTNNIKLNYDVDGEYGSPYAGATFSQLNYGHGRGYYPASGTYGTGVDFSTSSRSLQQYAGACQVQYYTIVPESRTVDAYFMGYASQNIVDGGYGLYPSGTMNEGDTIVGYNRFGNFSPGTSEAQFGSIFGAGLFSMPASFYAWNGSSYERWTLRQLIYNTNTGYTFIRFSGPSSVYPLRSGLGISIILQNPSDADHPWQIYPSTSSSFWWSTINNGNLFNNFKSYGFSYSSDYNSLWYSNSQTLPTSGTYVWALSSSTVSFY
jgi:hypothetical protein